MHPIVKRSWIRASNVYVSFPWPSVYIAYVVLSSWGGLAFNPANPLSASHNGFLHRNHACLRSLTYPSCTRMRVSMTGKNSTPRGNVRTLQSLLLSKLRIWNNRGDMRCLQLGASSPVSGDDAKLLDPEGDTLSDAQSRDGMVSTERVLLKRTQGQVDNVPELVSTKRASGTLRRIVERAIEIPEYAADEGKYLATAAFVGVMTGTADYVEVSDMRQPSLDTLQQAIMRMGCPKALALPFIVIHGALFQFLRIAATWG